MTDRPQRPSQRYIFGDSVVGRRERSSACATRAPRDTPALSDHGLHAALGCRCRGVDSASRSSILSTAKPVRGAGASEPDKHIVHALVGCRGPAAAGRHRGCDAETGVRALSRSRAGVHGPSHVAGSSGLGSRQSCDAERGLRNAPDASRQLVASVGLLWREAVHDYALYAMLAVGSEVPRATRARMCAALVGRVCEGEPPQRGRRKGTWRA